MRGSSTPWGAFVSGFTKAPQFHKILCFIKRLPMIFHFWWRHFTSENVACSALCFISFACGAFCFTKESCLQHIFVPYKILSVRHFISVSCLVYRFIGSENDSNSNTSWWQQHDFYQTTITKVANNKLLSNQTLWDTNRTSSYTMKTENLSEAKLFLHARSIFSLRELPEP